MQGHDRQAGPTHGVLKCRECRRSKQKCLPSDLPFPHQPCQRCSKNNLTCSRREFARSRTTPYQEEQITASLNQHDFFSQNIGNRCIITDPASCINNLASSQPPSTYDRQCVQRIDFYMSVHKLISMTWTDLLRSAKNLNFDQHCARKIDGALSRLPQFLGYLSSQKMKTSLQYSLLLDEPDIDVLYGRPVSNLLEETTMKRVSLYVQHLQQVGRHGSAYFVKLHHLRKYPHQFTVADRHLLEMIAEDFSKLISDNYDASWCNHGAPEPFWTSFVQSPLFPHESYLIMYTTKGKDSEYKALARSEFEAHDDRRDCLGRSVSHLHHDYGDHEDWKICRRETKGVDPDWRIEADLQHQDILGRTALHYACGEGDHKLVKRLLNAGADMTICTVTGMGAMHFAARGGYIRICKLLWEKRAYPIFAHDTPSLSSIKYPAPIICAAMANRGETVDFFCKQVLAPEALSHLASLLRMAVRKSCPEVVEALLQYKNHYNVAEMDSEGHDAMYYAQRLRRNRPEIEAKLIGALRVNADGISPRGTTAAWQSSLSKLFRFDIALSLNTNKRSRLKTACTLSNEVTEAALRKLLLVDDYVTTLLHHDLLRVRATVAQSKDQDALDKIDDVIIHRLRWVPEFHEQLSLPDLIFIRSIPRVAHDEDTLNIVERFIKELREQSQSRQMENAASFTSQHPALEQRKRRRISVDDETLNLPSASTGTQ